VLKSQKLCNSAGWSYKSLRTP